MQFKKMKSQFLHKNRNFCFKLWFIALLLGQAITANAQSIQSRAQAEEIIHYHTQRKQAINTEQQAKIQACYQKFASNPCVEQLKREAQLQQRTADQEILAAQRWIREDRAKEQQKRLSARASEQETQTGKPPAKPDSPPLDTTAQRHRLLAPRPSKAVQKRAPLNKPPDAAQIKENQERFDAKQQKAQEKAAQSKKRQADRAARNAQRGYETLPPSKGVEN